MSEQSTTEGTGSTEQQLPTPTPDPTPPPEDVKPTRASKSSGEGSGRFAVYNKTLLQFVGPVVDKKPTTAEAKKLVPEGHQIEVREV
jgi:hypothetical protein